MSVANVETGQKAISCTGQAESKSNQRWGALLFLALLIVMGVGAMGAPTPTSPSTAKPKPNTPSPAQHRQYDDALISKLLS
jgi:hypothetical protein